MVLHANLPNFLRDRIGVDPAPQSWETAIATKRQLLARSAATNEGQQTQTSPPCQVAGLGNKDHFARDDHHWDIIVIRIPGLHPEVKTLNLPLTNEVYSLFQLAIPSMHLHSRVTSPSGQTHLRRRKSGQMVLVSNRR